MIRSGFDDRAKMLATDPSGGLTLVVLAIATSVDALAIGLSLAMLRIKIWYPSVVIGVVTSGLSLLGLRLGTRLGVRFGKRMEIAGGAILALIGIRILLSHLLA
jgi:putative Mn2+ efflux pump MntP